MLHDLGASLPSVYSGESLTCFHDTFIPLSPCQQCVWMDAHSQDFCWSSLLWILLISYCCGCSWDKIVWRKHNNDKATIRKLQEGQMFLWLSIVVSSNTEDHFSALVLFFHLGIWAKAASQTHSGGQHFTDIGSVEGGALLSTIWANGSYLCQHGSHWRKRARGA